MVELTTQLLILENILWLPLCRINKIGLNTLPLKTVAIHYTCGLSAARSTEGDETAARPAPVISHANFPPLLAGRGSIGELRGVNEGASSLGRAGSKGPGLGPCSGRGLFFGFSYAELVAKPPTPRSPVVGHVRVGASLVGPVAC